MPPRRTAVRRTGREGTLGIGSSWRTVARVQLARGATAAPHFGNQPFTMMRTAVEADRRTRHSTRPPRATTEGRVTAGSTRYGCSGLMRARPGGFVVAGRRGFVSSPALLCLGEQTACAVGAGGRRGGSSSRTRATERLPAWNRLVLGENSYSCKVRVIYRVTSIEVYLSSVLWLKEVIYPRHEGKRSFLSPDVGRVGERRYFFLTRAGQEPTIHLPIRMPNRPSGQPNLKKNLHTLMRPPWVHATYSKTTIFAGGIG